jgi:GAF domain-containing protein/HAMP domain-containing protein
MTINHPSQSPISETKKFRGKIARNLLFVVLTLTLIPTFVMGLVSHLRTRALLIDQITEQLDEIINQETLELNNWLQKKENDISKIGDSRDFQTAIWILMNSSTSSETYRLAYDEIKNALSSNNFDEFLVSDIYGTVLAATRGEWETIDLSNEESINMHDLSEGDSSFITISPNLLYPQIGKQDSTPNYNSNIILITSFRLLNQQGELFGYLLGISNVFSLQRILETNSGYLPESKVFMVTGSGQVVGMTTLYGLVEISPSRDQRNIIQSGPQTKKSAIANESYNGLEVFSVYDYYDKLNAGILVETPQSKVFSQFNSIVPFSILIVIITIAIITILVFFGTQTFTRPILKIVEATQSFTEGEWDRRAEVIRNDEIGLLAYTFNQMAEELSNQYQSMERQMDEHVRQIILASEVGNLATSATSLESLLNQTVELLVERFNYYHANIFLIDEIKENAILRGASGNIGQNLISARYQIPLDNGSIIGWVAKNNKAKIASDILEDSLLTKHELLPETRSEIGCPISVGQEVLGVLNIQSREVGIFTPGVVDVLNTLANQLATAIQNFRLLENTKVDLQQTVEFYRASRRISKATTINDIFLSTCEAVQQTKFLSAVYIANEYIFELIQNPDYSIYYSDQLPLSLNISPSQAQAYLESDKPTIIHDVFQPEISIHPELLAMPERLQCQEAALLPIIQTGNLTGLLIIGSQEKSTITMTSVRPYTNLIDLVSTSLEKVSALSETEKRLEYLQIYNDFSLKIGYETDVQRLYRLIHEEVKAIIGDIDFYIALYNSKTDHIEIPYLYEGDVPIHIDPFPIGEGLTSIVVKSKKPLLLVEDTEEQAKALGARVIGEPAKSWIGIPLLVGGEVVGIMAAQDLKVEHRFSEEDVVILTTLAAPIAGAVHSAHLLEEAEQHTLHMETAARIARDTSATLDRDELLRKAVNLVREQFNFYHASVFLLDDEGEYAVVQESTGEAGHQMMLEQHKLKVGSKSIIGHVTATGEPLIVNDVSQDPTHRFNPLLPDTKAELGIPLMVGNQVLGALDVQSTTSFSFSDDDVKVLQILADQLAVAVINAELFTESQEHLAQHRLIHHVTTVAASSTGIDDALSSTVQGLRVTLGVRVAILLYDHHTDTLRLGAFSGYDDNILGLQVKMGEGITGWVAENRELLLVNDVLKDARYIPGKDTVRSELAVPLMFRGRLLGVLNIESDEVNAFNEYDQDTLGTLAGSLSAIIMNAQLSERQQQLFDITTKIRRSSSFETILETTADEISKALKTRRTRIKVGSEKAASDYYKNEDGDEAPQKKNQEGE